MSFCFVELLVDLKLQVSEYPDRLKKISDRVKELSDENRIFLKDLLDLENGSATDWDKVCCYWRKEGLDDQVLLDCREFLEKNPSFGTYLLLEEVFPPDPAEATRVQEKFFRTAIQQTSVLDDRILRLINTIQATSWEREKRRSLYLEIVNRFSPSLEGLRPIEVFEDVMKIQSWWNLSRPKSLPVSPEKFSNEEHLADLETVSKTSGAGVRVKGLHVFNEENVGYPRIRIGRGWFAMCYDRDSSQCLYKMSSFAGNRGSGELTVSDSNSVVSESRRGILESPHWERSTASTTSIPNQTLIHQYAELKLKQGRLTDLEQRKFQQLETQLLQRENPEITEERLAELKQNHMEKQRELDFCAQEQTNVNSEIHSLKQSKQQEDLENQKKYQELQRISDGIQKLKMNGGDPKKIAEQEQQAKTLRDEIDRNKSGFRKVRQKFDEQIKEKETRLGQIQLKKAELMEQMKKLRTEASLLRVAERFFEDGDFRNIDYQPVMVRTTSHRLLFDNTGMQELDYSVFVRQGRTLLPEPSDTSPDFSKSRTVNQWQEVATCFPRPACHANDDSTELVFYTNEIDDPSRLVIHPYLTLREELQRKKIDQSPSFADLDGILAREFPVEADNGASAANWQFRFLGRVDSEGVFLFEIKLTALIPNRMLNHPEEVIQRGLRIIAHRGSVFCKVPIDGFIEEIKKTN